MTQIRLSFLLSLVILTSLQSCNKGHEHMAKLVVIDTALAFGTTYQLNLEPYGDRDDVAAITKQSANFTISEISNVAGVFAPVYHYLSSANGKTTISDQVILSVTEGNRNNSNCAHHGDSTMITINFVVK